MQDIIWQILGLMGLIGGGFLMGFVCGKEQVKDEFLDRVRQLKKVARELKQERKKYLDII